MDGDKLIDPSEGAPDPKLDAIDLIIDPIWCPITQTDGLNTKDLYAHPGRFIRVDGPIEATVHIDTAKKEEFAKLLQTIYESGGSPDTVYISYDAAYEDGQIGYWTWRWLKLRSSLRSVGTRMQRAIFGGPSAPPTRGT